MDSTRIDQQEATRAAIAQLSKSFELFMKLVHCCATKSSGGLVKAQQLLGEASTLICRLTLEHGREATTEATSSEEMVIDSDQGTYDQTPESSSQSQVRNQASCGHSVRWSVLIVSCIFRTHMSAIPSLSGSTRWLSSAWTSPLQGLQVVKSRPRGQ